MMYATRLNRTRRISQGPSRAPDQKSDQGSGQRFARPSWLAVSSLAACVLIGPVMGSASAGFDPDPPPAAEPKDAQEDTPAGAPAAKPSADDDATVLAGPDVTRTDAPIAPEGFGGVSSERGAMAERVPQRIYLRAMRTLERHEDDALRLTAEQRRAVRSLEQAYRKEVAAFRAEHADEIRSMRAPDAMDKTDTADTADTAELKPSARPNERGPNGRSNERRTNDQQRNADSPQQQAGTTGQPNTPAADDARGDRLRALMAQAPPPEPTQRQMWDLLTEPQRQALMADIDAWRDQREERADEARMQRYKEQARDRFAEQEARRGGQQGMEGDPFDRLPSRVRERIESMPEAERVALMQRLSGLSRDERRAEIRKLMRDRD